VADPNDDLAPKEDDSENKPCGCSCVQDPFAALPPELRPKSKPTMGGLRKVTLSRLRYSLLDESGCRSVYGL
jgi:hypothetical protein